MLVPFGVLGGIYIGETYYWPYGYVEIARPYCTGITEDGCTLRWEEVQTEDGGTIPQCVQLCPRPGVAAPVPPPAVAEPAPAVAPAGACLLDIFADPGFAGKSDETDENQSELGEWDNAISSIEVKSGTWDFFTEPDFKGEVMRLPPGKYPDLGATFTKHIGSIMCLDR